jgi:glycosyltransferase involved in cell wall biosynthesis
MYKILYTGKNLRVRRRETIQNPPKGFIYESEYPLKNMPKDFELTGVINIKKSTSNILLKIFEIFQIPNIRIIINKNLNLFDIIHTPGQLLINKKNYVVEVDNVACLALYRLGTLYGFFGKYLIKYFLKRENCKKIICISNSAKNSVINFFKDKAITEKCEVSYPYVSPKKINIKKPSKKIKLLFVSSDFYLKGGRELVNAFKKLSITYNNLELNIITKKKSILEKDLILIKKLKNVFLIEANMDKRKLYEEYYFKSDLFVMPTYQDSFGLVFLEALSCGLGIISTDMFAVRELVENGKNGFLLKSPVRYFNKDDTPNKKWWSLSIHSFSRDYPDFFKGIEKELESVLSSLIENPQKIFELKKSSFEKYEKEFSEDLRKENLKRIYLEALK